MTIGDGDGEAETDADGLKLPDGLALGDWDGL